MASILSRPQCLAVMVLGLHLIPDMYLSWTSSFISNPLTPRCQLPIGQIWTCIFVSDKFGGGWFAFVELWFTQNVRATHIFFKAFNCRITIPDITRQLYLMFCQFYRLYTFNMTLEFLGHHQFIATSTDNICIDIRYTNSLEQGTHHIRFRWISCYLYWLFISGIWYTDKVVSQRNMSQTVINKANMMITNARSHNCCRPWL